MPNEFPYNQDSDEIEHPKTIEMKPTKKLVDYVSKNRNFKNTYLVRSNQIKTLKMFEKSNLQN